MNKKSYIVASIVGFIFVFIYEWIFHGMLLKETYHQTAYLWRPEADMQNYMPWMIAGQLSWPFIACLVFIKGFENKGLGEGVRFGVLLGLLYVPSHLMYYSVVPYPANLVVTWVIGGMIECIILGVFFAALYKSN